MNNQELDKSGVGQMFDSIAWRYDFLNHFLTLGIDNIWRKKAVKMISDRKDPVFLDVAAGTGDLTVELYKQKHPSRIVGVDISDGMLAVGREKMKKLGLDKIVTLENQNCENLTLQSDQFDAVTVGFGIRNFQNPSKGLSEMYRVLKPGGELIVLEFSRPRCKVMTFLFDLYFCYILPFIGRLFSKHSSAYTYLPESVKSFPHGKEFAAMMEKEGFTSVIFKRVTFGIATIYKGVK